MSMTPMQLSADPDRIDGASEPSTLLEGEARFRSAFDHAAIGMAIVSTQGRFLEVNAAISAILGYSEGELLARNFQSITFADDLNVDLTLMHQLLQGEIPDYQLAKRYVHKKDYIVWVLLSVSLVRDSSGTPLYFVSQLQDITKRRQAEDALRASEAEYRATFESDCVGKAQLDLTTLRFTRVNAKLSQITGFSREQLLDMTVADLTHEHDRDHVKSEMAEFRSGKVKEDAAEVRCVRADGQAVWVGMSATALKDRADRPRKLILTVQDITDRKLAMWLEQDRRRVLEMVARDLPLPEVLSRLAEAIERQVDGQAAVLVLQDGEVQLHAPNISRAWRNALENRSLSVASALSSGIWAAQHGCAITRVRTDGIWDSLRREADQANVRSSWSLSIHAADATPLGILAVFCPHERTPSMTQFQTLDMASKLAGICIEHHQTTRQLAHLVRHDVLTGLPNRIMFEDRVQQALALAKRSGKHAAIFLLDIDKFKSINDTLGHNAGDSLLQQFAHRLNSRLRETDTMARLGGDEFIIVLPELETAQAANCVAQKLIDSLEAPFDLTDRKIQATCSIGIAVFPEHGDNPVLLRQRADQALYEVKAKGRNGFAMAV